MNKIYLPVFKSKDKYLFLTPSLIKNHELHHNDMNIVSNPVQENLSTFFSISRLEFNFFLHKEK
jgi:hypothetical protein